MSGGGESGGEAEVASPSVDAAAARALHWVTTERLLIRATLPGDSRAIAQIIDDVVISANGLTSGAKREMRQLVLFAPRGVPGMAVILDRATRRTLGVITTASMEGTQATCQLGWWLGSRYRGLGYGTEAVGAAVAALHAAGIWRVVFGTARNNVGVRRVMEKIDARHFATGPHTLPNGEVIESLWFVHLGEAA